MKNSNEMQTALNEQINAELYSAYLYLAMGSYFEELNFKGFAHWMYVQAQEEMDHANRFIKYIHERRWQVKLMDIAALKANSWHVPKEVFAAAFAHEQEVTQRINNLMDMAIMLKDYPTQSMLKWFVDEQVEEEASLDLILQKFDLVDNNQGFLLMLDAELEKRASE